MQDLRDHYEAHLKAQGRPDVVIDLSGVGFAGSAALGNFVALQRLVRSKGGRIVFCEVDPTVTEVFRASKLDSLFEFVADRVGRSPGHQRAARPRPRPIEKPAASDPTRPTSPLRDERSGRSAEITVRERRCLRLALAAVSRSSRPANHDRQRYTVCSACCRSNRRPASSPRDLRPRTRNPYFAGSKAMAVTPRIQVNEADGVKVVRFQDNQLFDERTVREASDQIAAALPNDGSPIRLVVDFSDVGLISSTFLSKLILLQRRIDQTRGKLRLCEMSPIIQQVFRTSNLDRLFKIDRDQRTAIESFQ